MVFGVLSCRYVSKFFPVGPSLIILLDPPISSPLCSRDFFKVNRLSDNLPLPLAPNNSALLVSLKWLQVPPEWTPGSISFSFCAPLSLLYSPFCACPCILLVSQMCRAPFCLKLSHASAMDWQTSPLHCDCALLLVSRVSVQTSLLCCRLLQLSRIPMSIGSYLPILTQLVNIYVLCGC